MSVKLKKASKVGQEFGVNAIRAAQEKPIQISAAVNADLSDKAVKVVDAVSQVIGYTSSAAPCYLGGQVLKSFIDGAAGGSFQITL